MTTPPAVDPSNRSPSHIELQVATAPVNWNNFDLPNWRPVVPFPEILDRMVEAGYRLTEYDPSFGTDSDALLDPIRLRGMAFCGAYQWIDFLDENTFAIELDRLDVRLALLAAIGCHHLIVSDRLRTHRVKMAGVVPADRSASLLGEGYAILAANLHRLAERTSNAGISVHYHNHVGTYIETPWEVMELLARLDRQVVDLCFDTGHYAYGGGVAADFLGDHLEDIGFLHVKDVDQAVLDHARKHGWSFLDALRHYIFSPLGEGAADIGRVAKMLTRSSFPHVVVIEQDTCKGDPTENARQNREFLVSLSVSH